MLLCRSCDIRKGVFPPSLPRSNSIWTVVPLKRLDSAKDQITVVSDRALDLCFMDLSGRIVKEVKVTKGSTELDLTALVTRSKAFTTPAGSQPVAPVSQTRGSQRTNGIKAREHASDNHHLRSVATDHVQIEG